MRGVNGGCPTRPVFGAVAASATDRLHGRKHPCIRTRAGFAEDHAGHRPCQGSVAEAATAPKAVFALHMGAVESPLCEAWQGEGCAFRRCTRHAHARGKRGSASCGRGCKAVAGRHRTPRALVSPASLEAGEGAGFVPHRMGIIRIWKVSWLPQMIGEAGPVVGWPHCRRARTRRTGPLVVVGAVPPLFAVRKPPGGLKSR